MTNTWFRRKATIWTLVFVFLFTSVFSTGTAFAEIEGDDGSVYEGITATDIEIYGGDLTEDNWLIIPDEEEEATFNIRASIDYDVEPEMGVYVYFTSEYDWNYGTYLVYDPETGYSEGVASIPSHMRGGEYVLRGFRTEDECHWTANTIEETVSFYLQNDYYIAGDDEDGDYDDGEDPEGDVEYEPGLDESAAAKEIELYGEDLEEGNCLTLSSEEDEVTFLIRADIDFDVEPEWGYYVYFTTPEGWTYQTFLNYNPETGYCEGNAWFDYSYEDGEYTLKGFKTHDEENWIVNDIDETVSFTLNNPYYGSDDEDGDYDDDDYDDDDYYDPSGDTDCSITIGHPDGSSYYESYGDPLSDEGMTIQVPYGTIDDVFLRVQLYGDADIDEDMELVEGDYSSYYKRELTPDENGEIHTSFTVTAENGNSATYRINVVEIPGDQITFSPSFAYFWDGQTYSYDFESEDYDCKALISAQIDIDAAQSGEGATVMVPYYYDEDYGIRLDLGIEDELSGIDVDEVYHLNDNGELTLQGTVTSADGSTVVPLKINFVRGTDGAGTGISRLQYCWQVMSEDPDEQRAVIADIDKDAAKSADGVDIIVPASGSFDFWIAADSDNYSKFEYDYWQSAGDSGITEIQFGRAYRYFGDDDNSWEFTVTSPDGKTVETYKFNIIRQDIQDCEEHTYGEWSPEGEFEARYCGVCGHKETREAHEHDYLISYNESEHWNYCECGEVEEAIPHDYNMTVEEEATCESLGQALYQCDTCEYFYREDIPPLGHSTDENDWVYDDNEHWNVCGNCDEAINVEEHEFSQMTTPATCTEFGQTVYTCEFCGYSCEEDLEPLGHDIVTHKAKAATCTKAGYKAYETCSRCDYTTYKKVNAKGHKWEKSYTVDKTATANRYGSKSKHCATCDAVKSGTTVKIAKLKKTTVSSLVYNGKNRTQNVTVLNSSNKKLVKGKDYTVTYKNAKGKTVTPKLVGSYKAVIKFKGQYSGTTTKSFKINPQTTKIKKVTKGKKQFTVSWNKKTAQVTGYQIRYSTKSNMSGAGYKLVNSAKTTTKTIKSLKANKKYYVQIRTYKTVNGTKYYSAWSAKKYVTTK